MVLLSFPIGLLVRDRAIAYLAYIGLFNFVFTFQTAELLRAWVNGDRSAFGQDSSGLPYGLVNLIIFTVGIGLVTLGRKLAQRRRTKAAQAVDLARS